MKKNRLIKGISISFGFLLGFYINPFSMEVYADDVEEIESIKEKAEDKTIEERLKKISESNTNSTNKAKEILKIYSELISEQQIVANNFSIVKVNIDETHSNLNKKKEALGKKKVILDNKNKELNKQKDILMQEEKRLKEIKKEIEELKEVISEKRNLVNQRMVNLQTNSKEESNNILFAILNSESFSELLRKIFAMNMIQESDKELRMSLSSDLIKLDSLEYEQTAIVVDNVKTKEKIEEDFKVLQKDYKKLEKEILENEKELDLLRRDTEDFNKQSEDYLKDIEKITPEIERVSSDLVSYVSELEDLLSELDEKENESEIKTVKKVLEEIKSIERQFNSDITRNKLIDSTLIVDKSKYTEVQKKLVERAEHYLGVPYVWGGTSPNGLDCSGLTQRIYREALDIEITRVTYTQQHQGKEVPLSDIQVGDLIFWGEPTHHVAIYVGEGMYIHAPKPNDYVRYSSYDIAGASHIRRYVDYK